ncbi:MAG TPA: WD40 repeat domain-containing protein, partial [Acidobacteriota bacterium]|nr:WD40 repeat domain-containing protein [Acidobacteriota bacterium]
APPIAGEYPETALQILWRCLQKAPEDRFQSAKDLSFSLRQILLSEGTRSIPGIKKPRVRIYSYLLAASVLLFLFAGFTYWKAVAKKDPHPSYQRLTFRRGAIRSARFGPDGQTIFYGASWDGKPYQIFSTRSQSPESVTERPGFADILAISKKGEIAAGLQYRYETGWRGSSTLAKGSISGGSLRELLENVQDADWSPNGELAVVRYIRWDQCVLESPAGRVVYTPTGWVSHIRFSPDGGAIAFLDHPLPAHDSGTVCVIEKSGKKRILTESWSSVLGLAWHPQTNEIWFTAARAGFSRSLYAVNLSGEIRLIAGIPGPLTLHDISSNGKVLLSHDNSRRGILGLFPGNSAELDISWLDWSILRAISEDGTLILFDEQADGAGETQNDIYVRKTDGAPAVCLAESMASLQLTPDAKWVLATNLGRNKLLLLPVGAGSPIALPISGIESILWSPLTNNLKTILVTARKPTEGYRIFKIDEKGTTKPVSSEGIRYSFALSPDQTRIATSNMDGQIVMTDLSSQESRILPIAAEHLRPISWSKDGNFLFFDKTGELPTKIYRLSLTTNALEIWKELIPPDPAGVSSIFNVVMTLDTRYYAYSYRRVLSDLYVVSNLR